ncbi:hypothetical protein IPG41_06360 [Candidatus Peregrinibacteria bacterium]|nr:MAG: hypothetical protein IPG41_06360 [Candidatus Peregrinibacteria bacterium]
MNAELRDKILDSQKRTNRNFIIVLGVLILFEGILLAGIFTDPARTLLTQILGGLFALGLLALIIKLALLTFRPHPLLKLLQNEAHRIQTVEVLSIVYINGMNTYQMNLHFLTTEGERLVLSDKRSAIEAMLPLLKKELPHAEFKELRQR